MRGGLLLTLLGCRARTPLDWTHAWAMLGEWAGTIAFPIPERGEWPRHGDGRYLRPDFADLTPPFLTWARPIFEQGALPSVSFPSRLLHTLSSRRQTVPKQGVNHRLQSATYSTRLPWEQSRSRTTTPTVAAQRAATACCVAHRRHHRCGHTPRAVILLEGVNYWGKIHDVSEFQCHFVTSFWEPASALF